MFTKLVLLCILGLMVQDAHSEYETMKLCEIEKLNLNQSVLTTGNHPVRQIICTSDADLCDRYGIKSVSVSNTKYPNLVSWKFEIVESNLPEFIKLINSSIVLKCERPESSTDTESVIQDSCRLSYVLQLKTVRKSNVLYLKLSKFRLTDGLHPVDQLRCNGGELCSLVNVTFVTCYKSTDIGAQDSWKCHDLRLLSFVHFVNLSIFCENVKGIFGDEVIRGSCGMNYSLRVNFRYKKLDSVQTLLLLKYAVTDGFNGFTYDPVLKCVGDKELCGKYAPPIVACTNKKTIGWECITTIPLPIGVSSNHSGVICKKVPGFKDSYIIENSCKLRYSLQKKEDVPHPPKERLIDSLWWIPNVPIIILIYIVYVVIKCTRKSSTQAVNSYNNRIYDTPIATYSVTSSVNNHNGEGYQIDSGYVDDIPIATYSDTTSASNHNGEGCRIDSGYDTPIATYSEHCDTTSASNHNGEGCHIDIDSGYVDININE